MKKLFAFTLGTLSAIGGFIDIGDLVADALVGARFGLALAWVTVLAVVGIACYAEMSARITIRTRRPAFDLIRSRLGPGYALFGLVGTFAVTGLLIMAELSGVGLALQLATSLHYLLWVPVVAAVVLILIWVLPFEAMERIYGLLGLTMLVFVVAVWQLHPDWSRLWASATAPGPTPTESWPTYLFFLVTLIGAQMTPYEMFFFSSGAIESRWKRKDLTEMRVNVLIGFPLGGLLAIAIQAVAFLAFFTLGIQVEHIAETVLPVGLALGKLGLAVALIGVFAATFGATLETLFSTGYQLAQYFGWSYGKVQPPAQAARFTTAIAGLLLLSAALALTALNPITVTILAVVFSATVLPFTFLPVLLVGNDRKVMGELTNGPISNTIGTITLGVSVLVAVSAIPLLILTRGGSS